jgi:hypothetical protein
MEFQKISADPRMSVWENELHQKVVIADRAKKPVLASGKLMGFQVDAVVAADKKGATRCTVRNLDGSID